LVTKGNGGGNKHSNFLGIGALCSMIGTLLAILFTSALRRKFPAEKNERPAFRLATGLFSGVLGAALIVGQEKPYLVLTGLLVSVFGFVVGESAVKDQLMQLIGNQTDKKKQESQRHYNKT